jgi:hypothetical protein
MQFGDSHAVWRQPGVSEEDMASTFWLEEYAKQEADS